MRKPKSLGHCLSVSGRVVQVQLSRAGLSSPLVHPPNPADEARAAPLIRTLMLQLGQTLSVWSRLAADRAATAESTGVTSPGLKSNKASLTSGEEAFALSSAHVGLLRALFAKEGWSAALADCLREVSHPSTSHMSFATNELSSSQFPAPPVEFISR